MELGNRLKKNAITTSPSLATNTLTNDQPSHFLTIPLRTEKVFFDITNNLALEGLGLIAQLTVQAYYGKTLSADGSKYIDANAIYDAKSHEKLTDIAASFLTLRRYWHPDNKHITIRSWQKVALYNLDTKESSRSYDAKSEINNFAWHKQCNVLALALNDGSVDILNNNTGSILKLQFSSELKITAVAWHPTKYLLAIGTSEGDVLIVNVEEEIAYEKKEIKQIFSKNKIFCKKHASYITALEWSSDGSLLLSASMVSSVRGEGCVNITETIKYTCMHSIKLNNDRTPWSVAISDDNSLMAVKDDSQQISIFDIASGALLLASQLRN